MLNHQTYFQFSHRWEKKLKKFVSITHFLMYLISFLEPLRLLEHSSASGTVLMQVKNDAKTIGSNAKSTLTSLSHHICLLTPQHFGKDISAPICLTMPSFWDTECSIWDFRTESDKNWQIKRKKCKLAEVCYPGEKFMNVRSNIYFVTL